jgi:ABC-type multidrug transport system ATPase subunit
LRAGQAEQARAKQHHGTWFGNEFAIACNAELVAGTTFVIAHRLARIKNADVIFVLDQGRIVERGAHDELLARNGLYSELQRAQSPDERRAVESLGASPTDKP